MTTQLETYIPLKDAARKYGISVKALTRLVQDGIIKLARTKEGDSVITVSTVDNDTAARIILEEIRPEQYEHLKGESIRLMEASRQFKISDQNLFNWAKRGHIQILDQDFQRMELDTADVKLVSEVFKRAKELTGSSIKAGWVLKQVISELSRE